MVWIVVLLCLGITALEGKPWEGSTGQGKPWEDSAKQPHDTTEGGDGKYEISENVGNGVKVKVNIELQLSNSSKDGQGEPNSGTDDPNPWTDDPDPWTDDPNLWTDDPNLWTDDPRPWTDNPRPWTDSYNPWTDDPYYVTDSPHPWTDDPRPWTDDPQPWTDDPQPWTDDYNSVTDYMTEKPNYETDEPNHATANYNSVTDEPGEKGAATLKGVDAKHKIFKVMGKTYVRIEQKLNWYQAREKCQQLGKDQQLGFSNGDLASMPTYEEFYEVTKAEEMQFEITGCHGSDRALDGIGCWIGLKTNGTDKTATWNWLNGGEPVTSTNKMWDYREPNMFYAADNDRKCVYVVDGRRSWNYKGVIYNFYCKKPLCSFLCQLF